MNRAVAMPSISMNRIDREEEKERLKSRRTHYAVTRRKENEAESALLLLTLEWKFSVMRYFRS